MSLWSALRGLSRGPEWLGEVQLIARLGFTEKQLETEFRSVTVLRLLAFLEILAKVEEFEAKEWQRKSVSRIP